MGSRLNIELTDLMSRTEISVKLYQVDLGEVEGDEPTGVLYENLAKVSFFDTDGEAVEFVLDSDPHEGKVTLSCDFNFFRYAPGDSKLKLLRLLYEHSISFTVHH